MLNTDEMYKSYKRVIRKQIKEIKNEIAEINKSKTKFKNVLLDNASIISANTKITRAELRQDDFYKGTCEFTSTDSSTDAYIDLIPSLRGSFDLVKKCMIKIDTLNGKIDEYKQRLVFFDIFKLVIRTHNNNIGTKIIKGEPTIPFSKFGSVEIKRKTRLYTHDENSIYRSNDKNIDWEQSKKQKQFLIDNGKLPLLHYKNDKGEIIGDNGGEAWIIYRSDNEGYWFHWNKKFCVLPNNLFYVLKPTGYNNEPNTTNEMKTMNIGDELFNMELGLATKAVIYRGIHPEVKLNYSK